MKWSAAGVGADRVILLVEEDILVVVLGPVTCTVYYKWGGRLKAYIRCALCSVG